QIRLVIDETPRSRELLHLFSKPLSSSRCWPGPLRVLDRPLPGHWLRSPVRLKRCPGILESAFVDAMAPIPLCTLLYCQASRRTSTPAWLWYCANGWCQAMQACGHRSLLLADFALVDLTGADSQPSLAIRLGDPARMRVARPVSPRR